VNDTNEVIREGRVRTWKLDLRHVTRDAVVRCDAANLSNVIGRRFGAAPRVTLKTISIIGAEVMLERLVRIMTSTTCDARTSLAPTLAFFQAVRSESDIEHAHPDESILDHIPRCTVACSAKID
jgi:hypothetical protein